MTRDKDFFKHVNERISRSEKIRDLKKDIISKTLQLNQLVAVDQAESLASHTRDICNRIESELGYDVKSTSEALVLWEVDYEELIDVISEYFHECRIDMSIEEINNFETLDDVVFYLCDYDLIMCG
jgi:RNA recognition motif-containing protein